MTELSVTTNVENAGWDAQKIKLKEKFTHLTDADLSFEEGKKDEMLQRVQTKIGKTKEELHTLIASL